MDYKKIGLLSLFSLVLISAFAAFPVESQLLLSETDPEGFKLDTWGFIIGIVSILAMPYSLLLLFINKKNFRRSLAWGWLTGFVLLILLVIAITADWFLDGDFTIY